MQVPCWTCLVVEAEVICVPCYIGTIRSLGPLKIQSRRNIDNLVVEDNRYVIRWQEVFLTPIRFEKAMSALTLRMS